jgi:uncharacterized NAD(P)/FAD-binding protein YdhS
MRVDIAILGGGFSGTMVAANLLRRATGPLTVAVVERRDAMGRGVAYSTTESCHLLNVPAAGMSAWPDEPGHFLAWLKAQPGFEDALPTTFAPRPLYGRYVESVLDEAERGAAPGVSFVRVRDEAVGLALTPTGARVDLAGSTPLEAGRVVLAIGHFPPADPPVPGAQSFYLSARYVAEPWVPGMLDAVGPDEDVLLIGAGLTAIDWALSLAARGHRGHMHLLSRQGRLPHVHVPGLSPRPAEPPGAPHTATGLLAWVRGEVRAAEGAGLDWRQAIDGLRPHLQGLWRGLSHAERRRFLRHARPFWEVHRHRMAPEVAGAIARLRDSGQLTLHAGRVTGYEDGPAAVRVSVRQRRGGSASVEVARVVNCTGPEADFRKKRHPLVANLLERGLVRPDALGMGIEVSDDGAVLDAQGTPSDTIFALGPVRKGGLWETTAVPELRGQARAIASRLS